MRVRIFPVAFALDNENSISPRIFGRLAFAAMNGAIPYDVAESYALYALTLNRGLAELEPVERPDWAKHLLPCNAERTKELAQNLWTSAEDELLVPAKRYLPSE